MSCEINCAVMCRACMKIDGFLIPMYDDETISRKNLPDKLAELTSIQIDRYDGLPKMLCAKCAYRTDAFYDFKLQVQATERKLRCMFETQMNVIKLEETDGGNEEYDISQFVIDGQDIHFTNEKKGSELAHGTFLMDRMDEVIKSDSAELLNEVKHLDICKIDIDSRDSYVSKSDEVDNQENGLLVDNIGIGINAELSKILQSEDYTIMYIPEDAADNIESSHGNNIPATKINNEYKKNIYLSSDSLETLNRSVSDQSVCGIAAIKEEALEGNVSENEGEKTVVKENSKKDFKTLAVNGNEKKEESEDSDSDYFIDPQDNILGSLNDTITRIKEIKVDATRTQYQCTLCLQNYDALTGILLHTIDNHVPSSGPFYCVVCEKDCDSRRDLISHVKTHTGQFPYSCFICNKAYTTKRYLKRHMVCHTDFPRYRCAKCGERFKAKQELESHIKTHVHGAPYACSQCPRIFNHKGNYKRHLISHLDPQGLHLPKYPCQVCGKRFLNNRTLETHTRVHTGEKPFKCDVCGRSFSQQGNLLNHARIHSNPRSYTCEVCGKRFNQRATLRDHSLLHTGEKPYVCNVCGIAFTFSAALRRHMWTHAGGKPFGCEICDARFVGKYDLRRHMRVHSDRPRGKRKRNTAKQDEDAATLPELKEEEVHVAEESGGIVLIEQVLLTRDVPGEVIQQEESEKENVDALFNLIQYG